MTTHSSILAWRIPWTEEPGRLQSIRSHRVIHDWELSIGSIRYFFLKLDLSCLIKKHLICPWEKAERQQSGEATRGQGVTSRSGALPQSQRPSDCLPGTGGCGGSFPEGFPRITWGRKPKEILTSLMAMEWNGCYLGTDNFFFRWVEWWEDGMEVQEGGVICIHVADSLCYTAETNTTL